MDNEKQNDHKKEIKELLQKKIDQYNKLVEKALIQVGSIENISERVCAINSILKLDCCLLKLQRKLCSSKKPCPPHHKNKCSYNSCSGESNCCENCECGCKEKDKNKCSNDSCCSSELNCCENCECGCKEKDKNNCCQ